MSPESVEEFRRKINFYQVIFKRNKDFICQSSRPYSNWSLKGV